MRYLYNLAAAATNDHTTLLQLVDSNTTLTANVATLTSSLAALAAAYTILASGTPAPVPAAAPPAARPNRNRNLAPNGYCWTHGYRVGIGHNSLSCSNKAAGHKDTATRANIMGGCTANKNWEHSST